MFLYLYAILPMIQRWAKTTGLKTQIGCHTFRATGITIYLLNGGALEKTQRMAVHESPRTTKLYDRTSDQLSLLLPLTLIGRY